MSEAPKRVWLNVCIGSFEHLLRCESGTETMYVSEDALRELCEKWRDEGDAGMPVGFRNYQDVCTAFVKSLETLLEGK